MHIRACSRVAIPVCAALAAFAFSGPAHAQEETTESSYSLLGDLTIEVDGRYMRGNIDGYLQTPAGGQPGTTDHQRPTLGELGYGNENIWDGEITVQSHEHIFTFGARLVRLTGDARLSRQLTCENVTYPAGTDVNSNVDLDWYRLGYRYEFAFEPDEKGSQLSFAPGIDAVLFNFDYDLSASGGLRSDRNYAKPGMRIGADAEWDIAGPFSIEAGAWWGVPFDNTAEILSLELLGRYQIWGGRNMGASFYLGVAYDEIEYEDGQGVPNHISVEMGPMIVAGFDFRF